MKKMTLLRLDVFSVCLNGVLAAIPNPNPKPNLNPDPNFKP